MAVFVDTNVLVYARDASEPRKQPRATEWLAHLWRTGSGRVSLQVLQEYYVTVTQKLRPGLDRERARRDVRRLLVWRPLPIDVSVVERAWMVQDRFGLSLWDGMILAAARLTGCDSVLTEDLQDELDLDGIRVVNPFVHPPPDVPRASS